MGVELDAIGEADVEGLGSHVVDVHRAERLDEAAFIDADVVDREVDLAGLELVGGGDGDYVARERCAEREAQ